MYYISPVMYLIGGLSSAILNKVTVVCNHLELDYFDPPGRRACAFWTEFLSTALPYLVGPVARTYCQYSAFSDANRASNSVI